MKKRNSKAVTATTIIGGSDGPTSIFLVGKTGGRQGNLLRRFRDRWQFRQMQKRRARVMSVISPKPHTTDEVARYIRKKYRAVELAAKDSRAQEGYRNHKTSLVYKEQSERMEQMGYPLPDKKRPPDFHDRAAVEKWYEYMKEYDEAAMGLDDSFVPMDYHIYQIQVGYGCVLDVEMEKIRGLLNVSFSTTKKNRKVLKKIWRDIYRYYGVSQEDIKNSTDRYLTLVTVLAER